ncbi:MAG: hypothetical protein PHS07_02255 [Patescibacteria group bacterium]|nr:hypothetical protein [Patescibacteria group bacterium]
MNKKTIFRISALCLVMVSLSILSLWNLKNVSAQAVPALVILDKLSVRLGAAFGDHLPNTIWKITTPNIYIGNGLRGIMIGEGEGQRSGDLKVDQKVWAEEQFCVGGDGTDCVSSFSDLTAGLGEGDITDVLAGTGITVTNSGGPQPTVSLNASYTDGLYQTEIGSACPSGQYVSGVNDNGILVCSTPESGGEGDITGVIAGTGLTGGGTSGDVVLRLPECAIGQVLKYNSSDEWYCAGDDNTGIDYGAGTGISLVGTTINALKDQAIWNADKLQDRALANSTPAINQVLKWDGVEWAPADDIAGTGLPSGASGQTLRYDGTNWIANSNLYNNGTNVGIGGLTDPGYLLDIRNLLSTGTAMARLANNSATKLWTGLRLDRSGLAEKWFIGMNDLNEKLRIRRNGSTDDIVIDTSGNVGLGTENPATKLEVAGQVKITGGSPGTGKVLTSDASGLASWVTPASGGMTNPMTNLGDIIFGSTSGIPTRLAIGAVGKVLKVTGTGVLGWVDDIDTDTIFGVLTNKGLQKVGNNFGIINCATNGQILKYNTTLDAWYCASDDNTGTAYESGTGINIDGIEINALKDQALWNADELQGRSLATSTPAINQVLKWDGVEWAPADDEGGVSLPTGSNNQTLRYNGTTWVAAGNLLNDGTSLGIGGNNPDAGWDLSVQDGIVIKNGTNPGVIIGQGNGQTAGNIKADKDIWAVEKLCLGSDKNCISEWPEWIGPGGPDCGNNIVEMGEYCDGVAIPETCASLGYGGGTLSCNPNCTFNTSLCNESGVKYVFATGGTPTDDEITLSSMTNGTTQGRIWVIQDDIEYVGRDAADKICNNLAKNSTVLPSSVKPTYNSATNTYEGVTYKAWLSGKIGGEIYSPALNFIKASDDVSYVLPGFPLRTIAYGGWSDLIDGNLNRPIDINEDGVSISGRVFTGTNTLGEVARYDLLGVCGENWDVVFSSGVNHYWDAGTSTNNGSSWTMAYVVNSDCYVNNRIYCFQQ